MKLAFALLAFVVTLAYLSVKLAGPLLRSRVAKRTPHGKRAAKA